MKDIDRVYKVTILARGRTGGHAMTAPEDDKGMYNRSELFARLVFAMGGRAAEELVFGNPTTGASADIEMATNIARAMVVEYGMSPVVGAVKYGQDEGDPFVGRGGQGGNQPSQNVANQIDDQVRMLMNKAQQIAYEVLRDNRDYLDTLASKLLEKETLRRPDLESIFEGIETREVSDIFPMQDLDRPCDHREPVKTPVELARERGEEPPERTNFFSAARRARMEKRKAQNEKRQAERLQQGQQQFPQIQRSQNSPQAQQPQYGQNGQFVPPVPEERGFQLPAHEQPDHQQQKAHEAPEPQVAEEAQAPQPQPEPHVQPEPQEPQPQAEPQGQHRRQEMPKQTFPWEKNRNDDREQEDN